MPSSFVVDAPAAGARLDALVTERVPAISRTRARNLILAGNIRIDGRRVRPSHRMQPGEHVQLEIPAIEASTLRPLAMPLSIAYEDDDLVVLDKPAGLAMHPAPGHEEGTLVHGLLARYPDLPGINGFQRPGIVHRLDLNTSGLVVVAKTEPAMRSLSDQFQRRTIKKGYLTLVPGELREKTGVIEAPVGRDPVHRQRMGIVGAGRDARTRFVELDTLSGWAVVLALPETGRTHQIRVHFAAIGHPIAGDSLYGGDGRISARQFLHAALLRFRRPSDAAMIEVASPLSADLVQVLERLHDQAGAAPGEGSLSANRMLRLAENHFRPQS